MAQIIFAYITAPDAKTALKIGEQLVNNRLAACINVIPKMYSIYRWEGKICRDNEAVLIAKTRKPLFKKLERKVKSLHPYSCPCILQLPVTGGSKEYIRWLTKEV